MTGVTGPVGPGGPGGLDGLADAVHVVATLRAAADTGVLAALAGSSGTAPAVARRAGTHPRTTALLLEALDTLGLVTQDGAEYRLVAAGSESIGPLLASAERLGETVRTGRPPVDVASPSGAQRLYPAVVAGLSAAQRGAAERLAEAVEQSGGAGALEVLDVAAGGGVYGLALARRDPRRRVTALDLPDVLTTTRAAVDAAGLTGRFSFWGTDVLTVGEPAQPRFDLAVIGNLCHLFDTETCAELFRRVGALLRPGGQVAVVDVLPVGGEREAAGDRRAVALYALGLAGRTSAGGVHDLPSYRSWLALAGFGEPQVVALGGLPPLTALVARVTAQDRAPLRSGLPA